MKLRMQFVLMLAAGVASQVVSIAVSMILVRHLTKETFGIFSQVNFLIQFTSMILIAGIPGSVLYFYPRLSEEQKKGFFIQTIAILAFFGTVGSVILHLLSPLMGAQFNNPSLPSILSYYSYAVGLTMLAAFFPAFLMVTGRVRQAALTAFMLQVGQGAAMLSALYMVGSLHGIFLFQISFLTLFVFGGLVTTLFLLRKETFRLDLSLLLEQITYFLPITASNSVHYAGKQIDRYFVSAKFPVATFATFELGAREFPFVSQISENIGTVSKSKLSELAHKKDYTGLIRLWCDLMRKSWLMYCPLMALLFVTADDIYAILYTDSFVEAANLFRIFLLVMIFRTLNVGLIIESVGLTRVTGVASLFFAVSNVVLIFVFLHFFDMGLMGPPVATLLSYLAMVVMQAASLRRYCGIDLLRVMPFQYFLKVALITLAAALVGWLLMQTQTVGVLRIVAFCIGFVPTVLSGSWVSGLLDEEEKGMLRKAVRLSF